MSAPLKHAHNDAVMQVVADSIVDTEFAYYILVLTVSLREQQLNH